MSETALLRGYWMVAEIQSPVAGSSLCCEGSPPLSRPSREKRNQNV